MQQTKKYNFNLIDTSDPFSPEPLNENTQAVEDKLTALEAADAALEAADAKLNLAVQKAQSAADSAQATADSAYKPGQLPYYVGSYQGTGKDMAINIGFRPSFLIIDGTPGTSISNNAYVYCGYAVTTGGDILPQCVTITDTGFTVHANAGFPCMGEKNQTYNYIAFR